jgi:hypothetical protein
MYVSFLKNPSFFWATCFSTISRNLAIFLQFFVKFWLLKTPKKLDFRTFLIFKYIAFWLYIANQKIGW